jgi:hypothetical protein
MSSNVGASSSIVHSPPFKNQRVGSSTRPTIEELVEKYPLNTAIQIVASWEKPTPASVAPYVFTTDAHDNPFLAAEVLLAEESIYPRDLQTPITGVKDSNNSPATICYQEFASFIKSISLATLFNEKLVRNQLELFFTVLLETHADALPNDTLQLVKDLRVLFVNAMANQKRHQQACNRGASLSAERTQILESLRDSRSAFDQLTSSVQTDNRRRGVLDEAIINMERKLEEMRRERDALPETLAKNIFARDAMKQDGIQQYSFVKDLSAKTSGNNQEIDDLDSLIY